MRINRAALAGMVGVGGPMFVITGFWLMGWSPVASYFIALAVMTLGVTVVITGGLSRAHAQKQGLEVDAARFMLTPEISDQGARAEAAFQVDEPGFTRGADARHGGGGGAAARHGRPRGDSSLRV